MAEDRENRSRAIVFLHVFAIVSSFSSPFPLPSIAKEAAKSFVCLMSIHLPMEMFSCMYAALRVPRLFVCF